MGYKFSLVLSREITGDESKVLRGAGCSGATFGSDSLPTNSKISVTKMDFDDPVSSSLAEAIELALEAVKKVSDLSVPGLFVPAQPAESSGVEPETVAGEVIEEEVPVRKTRAKKASVKKTGTKGGFAKPAEGAVLSS
jgi:hypothetical protein